MSSIWTVVYVSLACVYLYFLSFGNPGLERRWFALLFVLMAVTFLTWTYLLMRKRYRDLFSRYPHLFASERSSRLAGRYGIIAALGGYTVIFLDLLRGNDELHRAIVPLGVIITLIGLMLVTFRMCIFGTNLMRAVSNDRTQA